MKYYKAMNKDFTCRGFQYEIGKTYELPKNQKLELCQNGFHFCNILNNCFRYYKKDDSIVCEVEPIGEIVGDSCSNKYATDKIRIIRVLSNDEIERERFHIQDGVKRVGFCCFENCKGLKNISIPDSVTTIGASCFRDCENLKEIKIPDSITSIGNFAFAYCKSLKKIKIPDSVTTIGYNAFAGCASLKSVAIPNRVEYIDRDAFFECTNLQKIYVSKDFNLDILENCILKSNIYMDDCAYHFDCTYLLDKVEIVMI